MTNHLLYDGCIYPCFENGIEYTPVFAMNTKSTQLKLMFHVKDEGTKFNPL